jgi:phosphatidylglycerophosphate synthase
MNIPKILIATRFFLCPLMLSLALSGNVNARPWIGLLLVLGVLTDILDGIIARKQNISTEKLRRMDSQVDLFFWLTIVATVCVINENFVAKHGVQIACLVALEIACYVTSLIRFGKETCTHSYLSKTFGIAMTLAFFQQIVFGNGTRLFPVMVTIGILSQLERILITLVLREWTHDIPSIVHAVKLRKGKPIKKFKLFN